MYRVVVASQNPVKIRSVTEGCAQMFAGETCAVSGVSVSSGVSDQPMSDADTYTGAVNRAHAVRLLYPDADYCVGIEGGLEEKEGEFEVFAWIVVLGKDGRMGKGRSATFFLPPPIAEHIQAGKELGQATDLVFNETDTKLHKGTVGILTAGAIDRTAYYVQPVIMALMPFKNFALYG